ncbi:MAG: hypothetical protein ACYCZD_03410 [Rhodanobacter sp.]
MPSPDGAIGSSSIARSFMKSTADSHRHVDPRMTCPRLDRQLP